jgi:SAM-dependent methyltransferase
MSSEHNPGQAGPGASAVDCNPGSADSGAAGRVLVVCERSGRAGREDGTLAFSLVYRFDASLADPFQEQAPTAGAPAAAWAVPERWRVLQADFRQQVLNRPFADLLTRVRPTSVRIEGLVGCTLDLPRIAALLGIPATVVLPPVSLLPEPSDRAAGWLRDALSAAAVLELPVGTAAAGDYSAFTDKEIHAHGSTAAPCRTTPANRGFDYALYEFALRDHPLLWRMQQDYVRFFDSCSRVLDLGCGAGIFLGLLEEAGIPAQGVERSTAIVRYARGLGFDVTESDALEYLECRREAFDGIYCSHFVEHLETAAVDRLLGLLAGALSRGGRAVLVFPDPESIRSQLLGFWRDPEHVRFYHPDLIELMGRAHGLDCIWHSHRDGPARAVVPFPDRPSGEALPPSADPPPRDGARDSPAPGRWERLMARVGLVPMQRLSDLERRLRSTEQSLAAMAQVLAQGQESVRRLREDTRVLWQVNQTWAWEDNAVLVLRKAEFQRPQSTPGTGGTVR